MALTPRLVSGSSAKRPEPSGINAMPLVHKNSTGQPWNKSGHDDRWLHCPRRGFRLLSVEFRVVPEDAVLVEWDAALRGEIGRNAGTGGDAIMHADDARMFGFEPRHHARKGVTQPGDDLEQRQVGIGDLRPYEMFLAGGVLLQYP